MDIHAYLEGIKNCPDKMITWETKFGRQYTSHQLTYDFGIKDNWPILLNCDYGQLVEALLSAPNDEFSHKYNLIERTVKDKKEWVKVNEEIEDGERYAQFRQEGNVFQGIEHYLKFMPGPVKLQVTNYQRGDWHWIFEPHASRQMLDYNVCAFLQPRGTSRPMKTFEALAAVVTDFCEYAIKNDLSLCLPRSQPEHESDDPSLIAYFEP
jgi:hypothetical protein